MGVQGAALASVLAWSVGFTLIIYLLVVRKKLIDWYPPGLASFIVSSRQLLKIGIPAAGANMLTPIAMGVLTSIVATHGTAAVAAFGVGIPLESLASVRDSCHSLMSLPPFISQNFGAGKMERVREAYRKAADLCFVTAIGHLSVFGCYCYRYCKWRLHETKRFAEILALFVWIMPLGYGLQGWIILTNSSLNALHLPLQALTVSVVRLFVMFVPLSILGNWLAGLPGLLYWWRGRKLHYGNFGLPLVYESQS